MSSVRPRVAFQGEPGAFSEEAAIKLLGNEILLVPRATFADLFKSIEAEVADYAIVPIENSLAGTIQPCRDLLHRSSLVITGEVIIPIAQQLVGISGATFAEIRSVESHPVALAQCEKFFQSQPHLERIEADDTAGSVARVIKSGDRRRAAIAGKRAAALYGGQILMENIQDDNENYTRFLLLSSTEFIHKAARMALNSLQAENREGGSSRLFSVAANIQSSDKKKEKDHDC